MTSSVSIDQITVYCSVVYVSDWPRAIWFKTQEARQEHQERFDREKEEKGFRSRWIDSQGEATLSEAVAEFLRQPGYNSDPRLLFPELFPEVWAEHEATLSRVTEVTLKDEARPPRSVIIQVYWTNREGVTSVEIKFSWIRPFAIWTNQFGEMEKWITKWVSSPDGAEVHLYESDLAFIRQVTVQINEICASIPQPAETATN